MEVLLTKQITKNWWNEFFAEFRPFFAKISPKVTNAEVKRSEEHTSELQSH